MATKPATTFTHATDANFTGGPAIGNPTKIIPPTPAQGLVPGTGGASEFINWLFNVIGQWLGWLNSGSSAAGEDAHIVETDSTGQTNVAGVVAGGTAAAYRPIVATENSGAAGATIDATNNSNGFAVLGTVNGSGAAIRGVSTGAGPALEAIGNLNVTGNSTLGNAGSDTLTINAATTIAEDVDFGANTITGAGGTITTSTMNASAVVPTEVRFNTTSAVTGNGRAAYDGRRLSVGDGSAARRIHHPKTAYVVSDNTTSAVEDITGASISMEIEDDEWVYFRITAMQTVSASSQDPKILLAATNGVDNVSILNTGDADQAQVILPTVVANGDTSPTGFVVRWKPTNDVGSPDNTSWTIRVRHGVTGATLTTSNVFFEGWYE